MNEIVTILISSPIGIILISVFIISLTAFIVSVISDIQKKNRR